jgi:hypothetical protein
MRKNEEMIAEVLPTKTEMITALMIRLESVSFMAVSPFNALGLRKWLKPSPEAMASERIG